VLFTLCEIDQIPDPGSRGFEIQLVNLETNLFVVHSDGQFYAFINSCPHTGVNLEWQENNFLDLEKTYIQCSTHDALFTIATGECIAGPCVGDSLTPVELTIDESRLCVDLETLPAT